MQDKIKRIKDLVKKLEKECDIVYNNESDGDYDPDWRNGSLELLWRFELGGKLDIESFGYCKTKESLIEEYPEAKNIGLALIIS